MKKYLIIKIAAIGDVIMAIPMVQKIREREPDADITWVCGKAVYPILQEFPIDHFIVVDEKHLLRGNKMEKIKVVLDLWKQIAFRHYDVIALGHASRRYKILTLLTRSEVFHAFSHVMGRIWPIPGRHHTDEYVRLVVNDFKKPVQSAIFPAINLSKKLEDKLSNSKKIIALAPGGARNLLADDGIRRWPIEHYAELAKQLVADNYQVVITGAPSDQWILPYFDDIDIVDFVGKTNLLQLIAVFQRVDAIVTHDSGPLHLAGMTKTPLVALFGPTNPYEKVPQRDNVKIVWNHQKYACCPCYDGKYYAKCSHNDCLADIKTEEVYSMIQEML